MIGPYKLLEQIGEGGMGVVYVAEQTHPVRRRVALKLIKPGMDTREVVARFEAERQALALMDHHNIAKFLDAGTTESSRHTPCAVAGDGTRRVPTTLAGRPYFVMELVRGLPITDYCDRAELAPRDRLRLFAQVCRAVQHAHMRGVIHRDLKPGNVLVTLYDGTPVPKVIDFGVAKALGQSLTEKTLYTRFAQMVGTPLYMAPEQAEWSGLDVDTRADVYSLGVLLYELLTGTTPFDAETLRRVGLDEVRRMIREDEPPRPSQRLSQIRNAECVMRNDKTTTVAGRVRAALLFWIPHSEFRIPNFGELDWVVMKALEKDRNRRYDSAGALAADVERYLADEPVEACPPTWWYRLRKSARRNQVALATAAVVAAALMAATAVSGWQAVKARDAERRAATEAAIAKAVNDFLQQDLLGNVGSVPQTTDEFGGKPDLTVKEALDRAAAGIGERFRDQPLVEAAIRQVVGAAYISLHRHQLAVPHLERALVLRRSHLGPDHADTLAAMTLLAVVYSWAGRHPEAIDLYQQVLESRKSHLGPDHPETLECAADLAGAYCTDGRWTVSMPMLERVLEKQRTILGPTHASTLITMHDLAMGYTEVGRFSRIYCAARNDSERSPDNVAYAHLRPGLSTSRATRPGGSTPSPSTGARTEPRRLPQPTQR